MDDADQPTENKRIAAFWLDAKVHARLNPASSYFGPTALEVVRPADWSYGETPDEANAFAVGVLADGQGTVSAPVDAYPEGDLPTVGTLSILCDGQGEPVALLQTDEVAVESQTVSERLKVIYAAD